MTPRCSGETPILAASGSRIGVAISMTAMGSMKSPSTSSTMLMRSSTTQGVVLSESMPSITAFGICCCTRTQPYAEAAAMMNITWTVWRADSQKICQSSSGRSSR